MKKKRNKGPVHNLDTLEKEIYRLKLRQKNQEIEMEKGLGALRKQGLLRLAGSILFGKRKDTYDKENIFSSFTRNERLNRFLGKFTDGMSERLANRFDDFIAGIFKKKAR